MVNGAVRVWFIAILREHIVIACGRMMYTIRRKSIYPITLCSGRVARLVSDIVRLEDCKNLEMLAV